MWIICRPGEDTFNTIVLFVGHIFAGGFWGGVGVCMLNLYIATSERDDRPSYIGMAFAVQSLVAGAIPLVGAAVLEMLRGYFQYGTDYRVFFVIVMALRLLALLSLLPVEEEGSRSIRDTIKQLRGISPRGMRSLSQLREGSDSRVRASAIEKIGQTQFTFATDELVKALGDPSPAVRRKASQALGSMRDPRAAEAVIRFVEQNPALADEEGLRAIGELGGPGALELLLRYLRDPRSLLRRGAARALGRLGDAGAVPALVKVAREVGEPDMRQAAIESLRLLGADGGQDALHDALFDPHPTVRIAAAEAVADLKISSARPYLRRALEYFPDEAASELAYALSVVGERQDLPEVIRAAEHAPSQISRRRSLLGAAALLGIENECHRLMMMDGIARDNALMRLLRTSYRQDRTLRAAVDTYGAGNEPEALRMLSEASHDEALSLFAQHPAEEAFLVAVVFYGNLRRPRSRKE
jgi:HEAT repeat protein